MLAHSCQGTLRCGRLLPYGRVERPLKMNPREYAAMFAVEDRHWWYRAVRREVAEALAGAPAAGRLLDAGCGTGGLLAGLRPGGIGLDVAVEAVVLARTRGLSCLAAGSVSELPFGADLFDAVVSVDVLSHRLADPPRALAELRRCLRPGGLLILQLPAFDWLRGPHDDAVWTTRRWRRGEVRRLVEEAGLEPVACRYRNSLLFPAVAAARLLARRSSHEDPRSDVGPVSLVWNRLFSGVLALERGLFRAGARLPFGLSVFCVARKPL